MNYELLAIFSFFVLGAAIGSFLNVWSRRLLRGESPTGRSHCEHCGQVLAAQDLIPLLSFFLQRGRCRYCKKPLSWQYPVVESATGVLFAALAVEQLAISGWQLSNTLSLSFLLVAASALIVIFITDLKEQVIFDQSLQVLGVGALLYRLAVRLPATEYRFLAYDLLAALGVYLFLQAIRKATKGRGLGDGDPPLGLLVALLTGFPGALVALFLAFVSGGAAGALLVLTKRKALKDRVAFGPFLAAAAIAALLWGERLWHWYLGVLGV